ncbi:MAG: TonB-dependent receptor plug domain-containing protein, partial [Runella zeae]
MRNFLLTSLGLLLVICVQLRAQERRVTGVVTSTTDGSVLPGVSVIVKGTNTGTQTDLNGSYAITATPQQTLVFSFVGMKTTEVVVGNQSIINLTLADEADVLSEVVVVGYGQQSKKLSTQTISTLSSKSIKDWPVLSPQQLLQGQAAGVQMVTSSGLLGSNPSIRIRGAASITAGGQPLFVIDGVPLNDGELTGAQGGGTALNPLMNINPNDIESMSVLKDAAAVSIYGSRGANGVILINTKKGLVDKKTQINVDMFTGFSKPTNLFPMMNTQQFNGFVGEYRAARGLAPLQLSNDYFDWVNAVVRNGKTNQINLSARGGSKNTSFYFAGTYG